MGKDQRNRPLNIKPYISYKYYSALTGHFQPKMRRNKKY